MLKHRTLVAILATILGIMGIVPSASFAQSPRECFNVPGISNCVEGRFLEFWQQSGGLPVFGYPISAATNETTPEGTYLTQYFERARFELHPENARPYDVLLGRLGDTRLQQQGRDWRTFTRADANAAHYFAETGHAVAHQPFWAYWSTHGIEFDGQAGVSAAESLALFGLPLSEPTVETNANGDTVLTQWFERARFEDHGIRGVLLGFLGKETYAPTTPPTPPTPTPGEAVITFLPTEDAFVHQEFPTQNFGKDGLLVADGQPVRQAYLKFDVKGLQGRRVAKAELRMYVTDIFDYEGGSITGGSVRRMPTNWSETAVTYDTRPVVDGPVLSTLGSTVQGEWYSFDVTGGVVVDEVLSFAITNSDFDGVYYNARETGSTSPQLIVTLAP